MKYGTHIRAIKYMFNQSRMFSVRTKLIQLNLPDLLRYQYSILWAYKKQKGTVTFTSFDFYIKLWIIGYNFLIIGICQNDGQLRMILLPNH